MKHIQRVVLTAVLLTASTAFAEAIAFISNLKGEVAVDGNARPPLLSELRIGNHGGSGSAARSRDSPGGWI